MIGQFRKIFSQAVGIAKLPLIFQQHNAHRRELFGNRGQFKNRFTVQIQVFLPESFAITFLKNRYPVFSDEHISGEFSCSVQTGEQTVKQSRPFLPHPIVARKNRNK